MDTSTLKFMKGAYPIQKYAIDDYLTLDLMSSIFEYTKEHYILPQMTKEEENMVRHSFESEPLKFSREIFKHEKVAKRFLRYLEETVAFNGRDTFSYTCRTAAENSMFIYQPSTSKSISMSSQNNNIVRVFSPLLNEWANDCALKVESLLEEVKVDKEKEELAQLHTLAKKFGKKLI